MTKHEKIVRYESKPLTAEQTARLKAVADLPDSEIDFSDIPELDEAFFENALRGDLLRPTKQQITLRLDATIVEWFRRKFPRGYQTEINKALLAHIIAVQRGAREKAD